MQSGATLAAALRRAVAAQRRALVELRNRSVIGDDAFHVAEEELDLLELTADERVRPEIWFPAPKERWDSRPQSGTVPP